MQKCVWIPLENIVGKINEVFFPVSQVGSISEIF